MKFRNPFIPGLGPRMGSLPRGGGDEGLANRFGVDLVSGKENDTGQGTRINLHLGGLTVGPELVALALLLFTLFQEEEPALTLPSP